MASDMSGAREQPRICEQLEHEQAADQVSEASSSDSEVCLIVRLLA